MPELTITLTANSINPDTLKGKTAVIIDILRASSVMITALQNGAKSIIPVENPDKAFKENRAGRLLCGERNARIIEGFDLGNSPFEFSSEVVGGKELIMSTTNGTRAILGARNAKEIYIGAFLNLKSLIHMIGKNNNALALICSGTNNAFSLDDFLFAGALVSEVRQFGNWILGDLESLAVTYWEQNRHNIHKAMSTCKHYGYLQKLGYVKDLEYCFQIDFIDLIPVVNQIGNELFVKKL